MSKKKNVNKEKWNEFSVRIFAIFVIGTIFVFGICASALVEIFDKC